MTSNYWFLGINLAMCGAQVLIIFVGGIPFSIAQQDPPQLWNQWVAAIVLGLASIPIGMLIRLIPDELVERCIPTYFKRKTKLPGFTISDEERFHEYPEAFVDVKNELVFLKKLKGGRVNNLKFAVKHPRDFMRTRSPSHSRSNSMREPQTPTGEDNIVTPAATPDSRARSKSTRSRSNSALGAPTVMAGIVAAGVAAGWSPIERSGSRDFGQPLRPTPSPLSHRETGETEASRPLAEVPQEVDEPAPSDVPRLAVPQPPSKHSKPSIS